MRSMRMPDGSRIPMAAITPVPIPDPVAPDAKVGRPEYYFKVIKQMVAKVVEKKKKSKQYVESTAQELAREKKHKGLFSGGIEINIKRNKE